MNRILLVGAAGQLGRELQRTLPPLGEVIGVGRDTMNLEQPDSIRQVVRDIQPNLIVNAAAYTAVDKAEQETDLADAINGTAPGILAEEATRLQAAFVHVSTDYVFDGQHSSPYAETDAAHPVSAYGRSKWLGEQNVRQACDRHLIFRTAWVYGTYGKSNFVKTMLRLGSERDQLRVVADQVGTPTWAHDIAQLITQMLTPLSLGIADADRFGTYHLTSSGAASWYDFAVAIFEEARLLGFPLKIQEVVPITTSEYPTPACRPAYSILSCQKLSIALQSYPPHWRQGLRQMLKELYLHSHESNHSVGR